MCKKKKNIFKSIPKYSCVKIWGILGEWNGGICGEYGVIPKYWGNIGGMGTRNGGMGTRNGGMGTRNGGMGTRNGGIGTRNGGIGTRNGGIGTSVKKWGILCIIIKKRNISYY